MVRSRVAMRTCFRPGAPADRGLSKPHLEQETLRGIPCAERQPWAITRQQLLSEASWARKSRAISRTASNFRDRAGAIRVSHPTFGFAGHSAMMVGTEQDAGDSNVRDAVSTEMVSHRRPGWPKSHVANNRDARRTRRATPPIPSGPLWLDKTSAARLSPDATCSDHSS